MTLFFHQPDLEKGEPKPTPIPVPEGINAASHGAGSGGASPNRASHDEAAPAWEPLVRQSLALAQAQTRRQASERQKGLTRRGEVTAAAAGPAGLGTSAAGAPDPSVAQVHASSEADILPQDNDLFDPDHLDSLDDPCAGEPMPMRADKDDTVPCSESEELDPLLGVFTGNAPMLHSARSGVPASAAPSCPSVWDLLLKPSLADVADADDIAAMLAAGEDPEALDPEGRPRPRHPVEPVTVLTLLRLAASFGSMEAWRAALRPSALTVLDVGNVETAEEVARVLRERLLPGLPATVGGAVEARHAQEVARWERSQVGSFSSGAAATALGDVPAAPALLLVSGIKTDYRTGGWDPAPAAQALTDALATDLPVLAVLAEPRRLPEELRSALPRPLPLAPLSRALVLHLLAATHSATGRLTASEVLGRLPSDAGLRRLGLPALLVALREPSPWRAAEALARLAGEGPRGGADESGREPPPSLVDLVGTGTLERAARLIVADLTAYAAGEVAWKDTTRSLLLLGEPGGGKTFAARAIAHSAGCPLVLGSLARWQAKGHLGDCLRAMRGTVAQALSRAPSVLFIDEIDAFGSRESADDHASNYRAQVIAGLLECLDGAEGREGVVVLAACNHPGDLDPAIRRPGRFDLLVEVPRPGPTALLAVLRRHLALDLARGGFAEADLAVLVQHARGRMPADVDAAVRAARSLARVTRRALTPADVAASLAPAHEPPAGVRRRAALHEAGHAIASVALGLGQPLRLVIGPGSSGQATVAALSHEGTPERLGAEVARLLAGREAERLSLGVVAGGAGGLPGQGSDLERATELATALELSLGLGGLGPLWAPPDWRRADRATVARIRKHLSAGEARARNILEANRTVLDRLASLLVERRDLEGDELHHALADVVTEGNGGDMPAQE